MVILIDDNLVLTEKTQQIADELASQKVDFE